MPRQKFIGPMKLTVEELKMKSVEVGDCWEWTNYSDKNGFPRMCRDGYGCITVRRLIFTETLNRRLNTRQPIVMKCENRSCVNPDHVKLSSHSELGKKNASDGKYSGLARRYKIAEKARKGQNVKLNMEIAREIRASDQRSSELAVIYGTDISNIKRVRANKSWVEYCNPFLGLMG